MSNYVKISCLGPEPYIIGLDVDHDTAVRMMIEHWETELAKVLPDKPDLIVLPEACDRSPNFPMDKRQAYYRVRGDRVLNRMREIAKDNHCYIAYSAAREMPDMTWRNSTVLLDRNGRAAGIYNKNHPVVTEIDLGGILCGKDASVIDCDFGRVGCAICFDLNFEEIRNKYVQQKPDLIIFSSMYHGGLMQNYWAYSCRSHFAGAVAGLPCTVISPVGQELASSTNYYKYLTTTVNLDCRVVHLDFNWDKLTKMKEKYGSKVKISDPGYLGAILISSETEEFTIDDMIKEFDIEDLDQYFERSMEHRRNNMEP